MPNMTYTLPTQVYRQESTSAVFSPRYAVKKQQLAVWNESHSKKRISINANPFSGISCSTWGAAQDSANTLALWEDFLPTKSWHATSSGMELPHQHRKPIAKAPAALAAGVRPGIGIR